MGTYSEIFNNVQTSFGVFDIEASYVPVSGDGWYTPEEPAYWEPQKVSGWLYDEEDELTIPADDNKFTPAQWEEIERALDGMAENKKTYYMELAAEIAYDRYMANRCGYDY